MGVPSLLVTAQPVVQVEWGSGPAAEPEPAFLASPLLQLLKEGAQQIQIQT